MLECGVEESSRRWGKGQVILGFIGLGGNNMELGHRSICVDVILIQ